MIYEWQVRECVDEVGQSDRHSLSESYADDV